MVKRLILWGLCLCVLAQAQSERLKVTLDEAVQLALVKNPRIAAALAMVRVREEEAEVVAAPGRPMGALYALAPPPAIFQSNFNTDYALSPARLEFRQLLMDGGRVLARFEQARTQASRAAQEAVNEEHRVCLEVRLAYLESLAAHARLKVAHESLESARRHQSLAQARFQAGQAPRGDLLTAELPVSERELELTRMRFRVQDSEEALSRLIGLPLDSSLELVEPPAPEPLTQSLEEALAEASLERPWLKAARLELAAAEKGVEAAGKENNPELQALLGGAIESTTENVVDGVGLRAGLTLSWPFLDGNRTRHLVAQAQATRDLASARLDEAVRQVEQEVRQAYRGVELARRSESTSQVRVSRAREALRVATAQYEAGFVPFHVVRDAQLDLDRARLEQVTIFYQVVEARARLDWALGRSPLPLQPRKDGSSGSRKGLTA